MAEAKRRRTPRAAPGEAPGSWLVRPYDVVEILVPESETESEWVHIGQPAEVGLYVPALPVNTTVTVQVAYDDEGTGGAGLVNGSGTAILALASGAGDVNVGANDMGAILAFGWIKIVIGAAQAADKSFMLIRKAVATAPIS